VSVASTVKFEGVTALPEMPYVATRAPPPDGTVSGLLTVTEKVDVPEPDLVSAGAGVDVVRSYNATALVKVGALA
jgi:hypothetical protein